MTISATHVSGTGVDLESAPAGIAIRELTSTGELSRCVELQRAVWGWSDLDLMPLRLFVLMRHAGGLVLGAFERADMVAFVNCVPGVCDGGAFWHSHMVGVLPSHQNRGIATALKLAQRRHALDRGVSAIQWVFDPLQAKNAYLNIAKLGAIVRRYSVDHYGASSSPLHAGLESDRLVAEWRIGAPLVCRDREVRTIAIPADVQALKAVDPSAVRPVQLAVRAAFLECLAAGFAATGFERRPGRGMYVLRRLETSAQSADGE